MYIPMSLQNSFRSRVFQISLPKSLPLVKFNFVHTLFLFPSLLIACLHTRNAACMCMCVMEYVCVRVCVCASVWVRGVAWGRTGKFFKFRNTNSDEPKFYYIMKCDRKSH